ncbi:Myb/SANT-like DNA-binding domain [Popillia japonica]|uniref:Regulatory protein zeste n=1 Tax=Popillia japonica TaxID=7064 RepID=A0AAW1HVU7_POPJA
METPTKRKSSHPSSNQKMMTMEFLKKNPQLISGKFSSNFSYKDAENLWVELAGVLNSMPDSEKTWKNWRKTWQDLRSRTKTKVSSNRKAMRETGGGPLVETPLDAIEEILQIIKPVSVDGHPEVRESVVIVDFIQNEDKKNTLKEIGGRLQEEWNTPGTSANAGTNSNIDKTKSHTCNSSSANGEVEDKSSRKIPKRAPTRLKHATAACDKYGKFLEEKVLIKEMYYNRKIELLQLSVDAQERLANAQERIANALENM